MNIFSIIIFSITSCILSLFIKKYNPEISFLISILAGVLIFSYVILESMPMFDRILYIFSLTGNDNGYLQQLIKGLGICFITQLTCDICEDSGQKAISTKVELAGKFCILLLALPIFSELISTIMEIVR